MLLHGDKITDWRIKLELELELNKTFRYCIAVIAFQYI